MSIEYAKVLAALKKPFMVIGRGPVSSKEFEHNTGVAVIQGGITQFLQSTPNRPTHAIVSVSVENISDVLQQLIAYDVPLILVEKPGCLDKEELDATRALCNQHSCKVFIAYNRRFYVSVQEANRLIDNDGGVSSFTFEFTEWPHVIEKTGHPALVKQQWFLANSSHVVDLAFYLGGKPQSIECFTSGSLAWHSSAAVFAGAGITKKNVPFSYHSNWASAGRWSVEILTAKRRLIFRPMERLQQQTIGSVEVQPVDLDYQIDTDFKAGLFRQVASFLNDDFSDFCTLQEQCEMIRIYNKIANYK